MEYTLEYLNQLILDEIQESDQLEYKASPFLGKQNDKRDKITKQVSAFANAGGGVLIFGVKEFDQDDKKHLPEKLDPIDQSEITREWLDQILSLIRPKINGLKIVPVPVTGNLVCYVVEIPQSDTAHQATDKRYYRRRNFESEPMDDVEIRDVMNRRAHPNLDLIFQIVKFTTGEIVPKVEVINRSTVTAIHYMVEFDFPVNFFGIKFQSDFTIHSRKSDAISYWRMKLSNQGRPLFPSQSELLYRKLEMNPKLPSPTTVVEWEDIRIKLYADNMAPKIFLKNPNKALDGWI